MFIEPLLNHNIYRGWVEVICGPMFSGKTEELIRRLKRAGIASKKVAIFKPMVDMRYNTDDVVSHDSNSIPSIRLSRAIEILDYSDDADVIGVDEVQFFDDKIVDVIQYLAYKGKRIIAAGLDMDSMRSLSVRCPGYWQLQNSLQNCMLFVLNVEHWQHIPTG